MQSKISLDKVLEIIDHADLEGCSETVNFINSLDFYLYTPEELKVISDHLGERLKSLLHHELTVTQARRR